MTVYGMHASDLIVAQPSLRTHFPIYFIQSLLIIHGFLFYDHALRQKIVCNKLQAKVVGCMTAGYGEARERERIKLGQQQKSKKKTHNTKTRSE